MLPLKLSLLFLLPWLSEAQASTEKGRVLFFAPWISKSIRIKALPLIQGLADHGHEVVLVMPFCDDCGKHENITLVNIKEYDGDVVKHTTILVTY